MLRNLLPTLVALALASPLLAQEAMLPDAGDASYQLNGSLTLKGEARNDSALGASSVTAGRDVFARAGLEFGMDIDEYFFAFGEIFAGDGDRFAEHDAGIAQLYIDLNHLLGSYTVRVGRQTFHLGDGRLVSDSPWTYEPNAFDGIMVRDDLSGGSWQAWHSKAASGPTNVLDDDFSGIFLEAPIGDSSQVEGYFLRRSQPDNDLEELTFAFRLAGETVHGLEWSAFGAWQDGEDASKEVLAQAFAITLRKRLDYGHGVGFELALAKGNDDKGTDRKRYSPVYIDQHAFNGRADIVAFSNLVDLAILYWLDWNERWSFHVDGHSFARQSNHDFVYLGHDAVAVTPASTSNAIGFELDAYCEGVISDHLTLDFGGAIFSPSGSIQATDEQFWLFMQIVFNF